MMAQACELHVRWSPKPRETIRRPKFEYFATKTNTEMGSFQKKIITAGNYTVNILSYSH